VTSCDASLPFTNSVPWPQGMVKCPSEVHFRISLVVVRERKREIGGRQQKRETFQLSENR